MNFQPNTPAHADFYFPAEWYPHRATWLSWPHKEASWPGKIQSIYKPYAQFIHEISLGEWVCINVLDNKMEEEAKKILSKESVDLNKIQFFHNPTNDAWCRDHGPAFLINKSNPHKKALVSWLYNAWGNKYPPYNLDVQIPSKIGQILDIPVFRPEIIMEGGSVDFNGEGSLITTKSCLLNPNRNPNLGQAEIEQYLQSYYGVEQIIWLGDGIIGDDTDGHIDDLTRFVSSDHVITMVEWNKKDENYEALQENLDFLKSVKLINGKPLKITEIPMPGPVIYEDIRLPASYANFYISNHSVIVPIFGDPHDEIALQKLRPLFPDRNVIGINSVDIIWGLGSFHCLSQQEPL